MWTPVLVLPHSQPYRQPWPDRHPERNRHQCQHLSAHRQRDRRRQPEPDADLHADTNANGNYEAVLPEGTIRLPPRPRLPARHGLRCIDVVSGTITTQNFALAPAATYTVTGVVTDANTGWPLYALIDIDGYPGDPI